MNYNDVIEYIDGTYDENFNEAKAWAEAHNTTFEEDMDKRDLPKRYFVIGSEPVIEPEPEPTIEELQGKVRGVRNYYLDGTDRYVSVPDFPITDEEREEYKVYRQYLRDYTKLENWWLNNPMTFAEWKEINNSDDVLSEAEETSDTEEAVSKTENAIEEID